MKAEIYTSDDGSEYEERDIPEEYQEAEKWRTNLIEAIADLNEDIMMSYLEGEEISEDELRAAIREATCNVEFYPLYTVDQHSKTKVFN